MFKTRIKFIRHHAPYNKGEIAGFPPAHANALVRKGAAIYCGEEKNKEATNLKNIMQAPETRHIPGPENTAHIPGPDQTKGPAEKRECPTCHKLFVNLESHVSNMHDAK